MSEYFSKDYQGNPFILFGVQHLAALASFLAVCLAIVLFRHRFTEKGRIYFRWGLFAIIYLCEGSWHIWKLAIGEWTIQGMLPLWLCSLTAWTMPALLVFKSQRYFQWAYTMGLIGAVMALLQPDLTNYGFPHYRFLEYFILHGSLVLAIIYFTAVEGYRPTIRAFPWVFLVTNAYWGFCAVVNKLIGSNYLYTAGKLPTPSLLDVLGPHPWYLLAMEAIGIVLSLSLYLPFYFIRKRRGFKPVQPLDS